MYWFYKNKRVYLETFRSYFLLSLMLLILWILLKNKNSLRTIEAQVVQKLKNNEARPKFTGSYKKKTCIPAAAQLCKPSKIV